MISIKDRANNDKYFNSIKFYYHNSNDTNKGKIFYQLLETNIYLAAHCIATDAPNGIFEAQAINKALELAGEFQDEITSSKALLALAELKQFSQILGIFDSVNIPRKNHHSVLNRVFQQADEETFLIFIDSFSEHRHLKLISICFLQYPNKLNLTQNVLYILQKFILKLYQENSVGFLRAFFEKFELYDFVGFFFDKDVIVLSQELIEKSGKHSILAYHVIKHFNYFRLIGLDYLITSYSSEKSNKILKYSLSIALEFKMYTNSKLNERIKILLTKPVIQYKKAGRNKQLVKRLINYGLISYIENTESLIEPFLNYSHRTNIKLISSLSFENSEDEIRDTISYFNTTVADMIINSLTKAEVGFSNSQQITVEDFWNYYFRSISPLIKYYPIEPIIERISQTFETDLRSLFKLIRKFPHLGVVKTITELGIYVVPVNFRSIRLIFLHKDQLVDFESIENEIENQITFRIIGYNLQTKRINASQLDLEQIIENGNQFEARQRKT
jgi:hypothetical protein